jgi:hypothetical protein
MPFRQPATGIRRCNPANLILLVGSPVIVKKKMDGVRTAPVSAVTKMGCGKSPAARGPIGRPFVRSILSIPSILTAKPTAI